MTAIEEKALRLAADAAHAEAPRAVIVVPTYNEALTLPTLLRELAEVIGPDDVVLVVDDASPDGTGAIADALADELPFVRVLHRPRKEGLDRAYEAGFRHALELGPEFVVDTDAARNLQPLRRLLLRARPLLRPVLLRLEAASERARSMAADRRLDWQSIAAAWLLSRVVVAAAVAPVRLDLVHFRGVAQQGSTSVGPLLSWDTRWYEAIAARGYYVIPGRQSDVAFFPLYPTILHILRAAGASGWWVGSIVSTVLFLPALLLAYELVRSWLPRADARRAAIYVALSPLGFVFSMVYPEALALALVAGAAVAVVKHHYALGLVAGALAGLGRPEAVFIVLPLALAVRAAWPDLPQRQRVLAVAAAGAPLAGVGGFVLYQWARLQTPFAYVSAQRGWGRHFNLGGVYTAVSELMRAGRIHDDWLWRDAAFLLIYVAALALARRARVPWPWLAASAAIVLLPLESGSLTSISRFGLLAPALFAGLAYAGRRWAVDVGIRAASVATLAVFSLTLPLHWP